MTISVRFAALAVVIAAALGGWATRKFYPDIQTKTEFVEKEVVKKDIVTVVKEIIRPDGTKETVTETTDKSVEKKDTKDTKVVAAPKKPDWLVGAAVFSPKFSDFSKPDYGIQVSRRVLGPAFLGGSYKTDGSFGLHIQVEF